MAYDQDLANRVREQLAAEDAVTEKEMFGGIAFLLSSALEQPHARPFDMTGSPMKAWVLVAPAAVGTTAALRAWVERGVTVARSLPPKG